jgi:hypothetical protein
MSYFITFFVTIAGILLALFSSLVAYREKKRVLKSHDKPENRLFDFKNARTTFRISLLGVFAGIAGAGATLYFSRLGESKADLAEIQTKRFQQKVAALNEELVRKTARIQDLNYRLINNSDTLKQESISLKLAGDSIQALQIDQLKDAKSIIQTQEHVIAEQASQVKRDGQILDKQAETYKEITGDNNRPDICFDGEKVRGADTMYQMSFWVYNSSSYLLNDVNIELDEFYKTGPGKMYSMHRTFSIGKLSPGDSRVFYEGIVPIAYNDSGYNYDLTIRWERGAYAIGLHVLNKPGKYGWLPCDMTTYEVVTQRLITPLVEGRNN